jgi:hypothetical protein
MGLENPLGSLLALEVEANEPDLFREEELMPSISGSDWESIQARINSANSTLKEELALQIKGKTIPEWLKESLAIAVLMVGTSFIVFHYIPAEIRSETITQANDIASLKTSVEQIHQDVTDIKRQTENAINRALDNALKAAPGASRRESKKTSALSVGKSAIQFANGLGISLDLNAVTTFGRRALETPSDKEVLEAVSTQLWQQQNDNKEPAGYWPSVLQFIQFATAVTGKDVPIRGKQTYTISNNRGFLSLGSVSHAVILLDGGDLGPVRFDHCRIIFTEASVRMRGVYFADCIFEFPTTESPNPYLKNAVRQLLASNLNSILL